MTEMQGNLIARMLQKTRWPKGIDSRFSTKVRCLCCFDHWSSTKWLVRAT